MRIRLQHRAVFIYDHPAASIIQVLRLTPRNTQAQHVRHWRLDLDQDVQMLSNEDAFGNIVNSLSFMRPVDDLAITVQGEIETHDTHGIVRGAIERFPAGLFLRETALTQPVPAIRKFAQDKAGKGETLERLHKLVAAVYEEMEVDPKPTGAVLTATMAFSGARGTPKDLAHVFIAAARSLDVPARYVAGYLLAGQGEEESGGWRAAAHAWAEAYVEDIGWIGFDPAIGASPGASHIRVSMALDYLGAAPLRGTYQGGIEERLDVTVLAAHADHPARQHQQ